MPMIPILLSCGSSFFEAEDYVDSGAFCSLFNSGIAESLGLDMTLGRKLCFTVGDGKTIQARMLKVPVQIGDEVFVSDIAFSSELRVGFNLLGRKGIFEHFEQVIFNEKERKVIFKKHLVKENRNELKEPAVSYEVKKSKSLLKPDAIL